MSVGYSRMIQRRDDWHSVVCKAIEPTNAVLHPVLSGAVARRMPSRHRVDLHVTGGFDMFSIFHVFLVVLADL